MKDSWIEEKRAAARLAYEYYMHGETLYLILSYETISYETLKNFWNMLYNNDKKAQLSVVVTAQNFQILWK